MLRSPISIVVVLTFVVISTGAQANVFDLPTGLTSLQTVAVGNAGNPADFRYPGPNPYPGPGYGSVAYEYQMGKHEVTARQYTDFLNAVAKDDTYGLYNTRMWSDSYGCKIARSGVSGNYSYSVAADYANRPVNYVSWADTVRFVNWLTNGQPTGAQGLATTEDGSYYLGGVTTDALLMAVTRSANAEWVIPNEDEWHKAAYHKNDGRTDHYWDYPTGTNDYLSNQLASPDGGDNANFYINGTYTIGAPYYHTEVGEFENSSSPYGTFDQGGNVYEWTEAVFLTNLRTLKGGSHSATLASLHASNRSGNAPTVELSSIGFRVAYVPEPATFVLLGLGVLGVVHRGRRSGT